MPSPKHTPKPLGKSEWQPTPTTNLIRYLPSGTYFLRAKVGRKVVRQSLKTDNYRAACVLVGELLPRLRAGSSRLAGNDAPKTLRDALALVRNAVANDPTTKAATRDAYFEQLDALGAGRKTEVPATLLPLLTAEEMEQWWKTTANAFHPQRANHLLMFVRRALKAARKRGAMTHDPSEDLKRLKIHRKRLDLLTPAQFAAIVKSVGAQGQANSAEAARWLEFMCYSGMRPAEIYALEWRDIDTAGGIIEVWGGVDRTKNGLSRRVPIIDAMADLIERLRGGETRAGRVFTLRSPHEALRSACARLKLPHQRIYDLRHTFATMCNASGVDVPTFAKWLGHQDGGTLAMKTYVHPDEEHSLMSAKKVQFSTRPKEDCE